MVTQLKGLRRLKVRPFVTVVMPAYNAEKFIRNAIESVLNQKFQRFELIVIDDCSADNTYHIAKEYTKDPRVRLCRNFKRAGNAKTRNKILKLARGKYIAPLDADDIMLQGRLSDQCHFLETHRAFGAVFGKAFVTEEDLKTFIGTIVPANRNHSPFSRSGAITQLPTGFNHGTAMIRRKYFFKAGLYETSLPLGSDARLMRRIFRITKFYFLNKFCFIYRMQSRSLCHQQLLENRDSMAKIFRMRGKNSPAVLTLCINGRWIRARIRSGELLKMLRWRLNFYSWQAQRRRKCADKKAIVVKINESEMSRQSEKETFYRCFLRPFAAVLAKTEKIVIEAGLVSCFQKGLLIIAEEAVRAEAILSFLNRDFYYYSSNNPILYERCGQIYGRALIDPLEISRPILPTGRARRNWGQGWNPILRKHYLNVCYYRPYSIGSVCRISALLFIQTDNSAHRIRTRRLNFREAHSLLLENMDKKNISDGKVESILVKTMRKTKKFLIKAPQDLIGRAAADFKF